MDSIMDSDTNRQSGVCHFSILFLVSFLSMVVAIIIVRKTQELKQLEECMMEKQVDSENRTKILGTMHQKKWNHIKQQYTQETKSRIIIYEWHNICCETLFLLKNEENTGLLLSETILDKKGQTLTNSTKISIPPSVRSACKMNRKNGK